MAIETHLGMSEAIEEETREEREEAERHFRISYYEFSSDV
jgi:hypothetical protein